MLITSLQNNRIKNVIKLRQRRQRDALRLTVVEGVRETLCALQNHVVPQEAYICPELINGVGAETAVSLLHQLVQSQSTQLFEVSPELFAKMAYREGSGGLLLVIPYREYNLDDLAAKLSEKNLPFLVVIEGVEKPGNLGAILRTADAAGVDGVILSRSKVDSSTDLHNPNTIRASLGTIFTVPVVTETNDKITDWLRKQGIRIVGTTPEAKTSFTAVSLTGPVALVMGSEAHGLSEDWLSVADEQVMIPMHGIVDSLNLSVAAALLLYEVVRQRSSKI